MFAIVVKIEYLITTIVTRYKSVVIYVKDYLRFVVLSFCFAIWTKSLNACLTCNIVTTFGHHWILSNIVAYSARKCFL